MNGPILLCVVLTIIYPLSVDPFHRWLPIGTVSATTSDRTTTGTHDGTLTCPLLITFPKLQSTMLTQTQMRLWPSALIGLITSHVLVLAQPVINFNDIITAPPEPGLGLRGGLGNTRREPGQPVYSVLHDDVFPTQNEARGDIVELLNRYAPVFKLSSVLPISTSCLRSWLSLTLGCRKEEEYYPSSVDFMIPHFDHVRSHPVRLPLPSPAHDQEADTAAILCRLSISKAPSSLL